MNEIQLNKSQKIKYFKYVKKEYSNCFLNTSIDSGIEFTVILKSFFNYKAYKPKGNWDDAMFLCKIWMKYGQSGFIGNPKKHETLRFIKLIIAAKYSIQYERYDLTIRINKLLITYFPNPNYN